MGFLDRLLGRSEQPEQPEPPRRATAPQRSDDEIAVERYRYLLRTAPPETIEQVHTEAFSKLTAEQRDLLFTQLSENAMAGERPANAEPATLAKAATRAELRQPGTLLGTVAGYVVGSALVSTFLPDSGGADASADAGGESGADSGGDAGTDSAGEGGEADYGSGGGDYGGGDYGGDSGGFGGGDFGGGDFGGDFGSF
jgi:hypothetical protein